MLKQLDLCSGVGCGFPLAGQKLGGFELIGLCDKDPYCQDILAKRFPGIPIYPEIKQLNHHERIDILTASPPCQPFSVQGKRQGAADERDCLPYVLEAIACLRPRYFCIENVLGILSCPFTPGSTTKYLAVLLHALTQCGYDCEWLPVGSGHLSSPFLRRRVLLVGVSRGSLKLEEQVPWTEQARRAVEEVWSSTKKGVLKSKLFGGVVPSPPEVDGSIGVPTGCRVNKERRGAIGNGLDPLVAQLALKRVLYLENQLPK